ncbi:probable beta-d-xylosidase 6, partial [Phtheirospermum japonicum]
SYPFCNTSLPLRTQAQSLIYLLSVDEKIQQLSNNASAVPRLGIPPYEWWSESLHTITVNGPSVSFDGPIKSTTRFPRVILSATTFNRSLWSAVAIRLFTWDNYPVFWLRNTLGFFRFLNLGRNENGFRVGNGRYFSKFRLFSK